MKLLPLVTALLLTACPPPTDPVTPPPPSQPCQEACDRMAELGCDGFAGSPGGTSCTQVCIDTEQSGVARFCPNAVAAVNSCEELTAAFAACDSEGQVHHH